MATFYAAIGYVLTNEGGALNNNPKTGEYSKYGITLKLAVAVGACADGDCAYICNLNVQSATAFYAAHVWLALLDGVRNQAVATKILDMIVNMGAPEAVVLAQRACNALGATISTDGHLGYATLTAINMRDAAELALELCAECVTFYTALVAKDPAKYSGFWNEWKARGEKRP